MWLTRTAVNRPVTTLMASTIVVLLGWMALRNLSVDLMPEIQFPTVSVETLYPGAGPEEVETLITRPLEQTLSSVNGFERLTSRSLEGSSTIRVQFTWGTDLDSAMADMRQSIDKVRDELPDEIDPPVLERYDVNDSPIMYLGLQSDLPLTELTRLLDRSIMPRLERLDGVARVGARGEVRREIQVNLDRAKLEALGMGVNEVIEALQQGNVSQPAGDFDEGHMQRLLRSRTEFASLEDIRSLIVRNRLDAVVRVRDVAEVVDGHEEITQLTRTNGEPGIMVYIFKQAGANTIDVSTEVHEAVEKINRDIPDANLVIRMDQSRFIRNAIDNIRMSALIGMGLAMAVLILFLRSFRSTLIIGVSMPLSVLATFVLIYFGGFTLNMVSFGGLVLGIGMLVDNSIVVLESIFRKREEGLTARGAAVEGTREVSAAITASTLTTMIVFLPLLFIEGVTGVLVHQLAYVVSFSLVCSLIASMSLTPALAAYWIRNTPDETVRGARGLRKLSETLHLVSRSSLGLAERAYGGVVRTALRFPAATAFALLFVMAAVAGLLPRVGTDFLPKTDDGRLGVTGRMAAGIQLATLDRQTKVIERTVTDLVPDAESMSVFIGDDADDGDDWNEARLIVQLSPSSARSITSEDVRKQIEDSLPPIAGMELKVRAWGAIRLFRMFGSDEGDNLAVLINGHDRETASELAAAVVRVMESIPGITNVEVQEDEKRPELETLVDREKARLLGISVQDITQTLESTIRGTPATVFRDDGDEFNVMVRLREADRSRLSDIGQVGVATASQRIIPLRNLVDFKPGEAPMAIDRSDKQRVSVVTAGTEGRDLGAVVGELQSRLDALPRPEGFDVVIRGDWEEQQESFRTLQFGFLLAVLLMYMIMAAQFESLRDPLLILVTLPLAAIGVILVLVFWDTTLNAQSFIGLVVLAGIVVNNAIVLIDYVNQLRRLRPERDLSEIIEQAAVRRFRPIIMTTLTTVLGMLPVALALGEGSELQAPLARVVVGGLISGTLITLVAIPVVCFVASGRRVDAGPDEETEAARSSELVPAS